MLLAASLGTAVVLLIAMSLGLGGWLCGAGGAGWAGLGWRMPIGAPHAVTGLPVPVPDGQRLWVKVLV